MGTPFSEFHVISATHGRSRRRSGAFIVNFEQILHPFSIVSITDFEHANDSWVSYSSLYCHMVFC